MTSSHSNLEELHAPSEPFCVAAFAAHAKRVAYRPAPGDEELLRRAGRVDFSMQPLPDIASAVHPLLSLRPALRRDAAGAAAEEWNRNGKRKTRKPPKDCIFRGRLRGLAAVAIAGGRPEALEESLQNPVAEAALSEITAGLGAAGRASGRHAVLGHIAACDGGGVAAPTVGSAAATAATPSDGYLPNAVPPPPLPALLPPAPLPIGSVLLRVSFFAHEQKAREFEVHSDNTLLELRERLACITEVELAYQREQFEKRRGSGSSAQEPPAPPPPPLPSRAAAFCIEGQWFVDADEGDDPTAAARAWLAERRSGHRAAAAAHAAQVCGCTTGTGTGTTASSGASPSRACLDGTRHEADEDDEPTPPRPMSEVRFGDLRLRLGAQYLFVHHGSCEHSIVFTRCALPQSVDDGRTFPSLVFERFDKPPRCVVCNRETAEWEVHGDRLADVLPCRLCPSCHHQAHYTAEGAARRRDYRIYPLLRPPELSGVGEDGEVIRPGPLPAVEEISYRHR